jgi:hypothetical protein
LRSRQSGKFDIEVDSVRESYPAGINGEREAQSAGNEQNHAQLTGLPFDHSEIAALTGTGEGQI